MNSPRRQIRKVFVGPFPVSSYYGLIARSLTRTGLEADYFLLGDQGGQFSDLLPKTTALSRLVVHMWNVRRNSNSRPWFARKFLGLVHEGLSLAFFCWALFRYDAFIFGFGVSLLPNNADTLFYKALGKRTIFVFNGSDVRPGYIGVEGASMLGETMDIDDLARSIQVKTRMIQRLEQRADVLVNWLPMSLFFTRPFVSFLAMGLLNITDEAKALERSREARSRPGNAVRILHSPSNIKGKGTAKIREIIQGLSKKYAIEWIELVDVPNHQVINELANCDFVVDQLYSDTPMAGFALEAAWYGKPAVVGGYYAERISEDVDVQTLPPSLFVVPEEMAAAIERLVGDADYRRQLGKEAQAFVSNRWSERAAGLRWRQLIEGDIPMEWLQDPAHSDYYLGCSISDDRARQVVQMLIDRGGISALGLDHKATVRDSFVEFMTEGARSGPSACSSAEPGPCGASA